ncbi:hypothetical protein AAE115_004513 [Salmonella enterica]|nr:hypothetical protein [Salmonella enterica]EJM4069286.1 hypothetical protein [Salmonella enterica]
MSDLSVEQRLKVARIAADFAISATSQPALEPGKYHQFLYGSKYIIDIYKVIYEEIIKSVDPHHKKDV